MFFGFWQFKTTVSLLLLASCLGQELFRTCDRDYCYERSIERRNIEEDPLREWHRSERLLDDTQRKNQFLQKHSENSDFVSRRLNSRRKSVENPRELDNLTTNRRQLEDAPSLRITNKHHTLTDGYVVDVLSVDKRNNYRVPDRRFDDVRRNERLSQRSLEDIQHPFENARKDRLVASTNLNERKNQQVESRESLNDNDRLSETRYDTEESRQRDFNNLNQESRRLTERTVDEITKPLQDRNDVRLHINRVLETESRSELSERDEFRRLPQRQQDTLDNYERLTENRRLIERLSKNENRQERENRLERSQESRRSIDRLSDIERLPEEHENQRSRDRLPEADFEKEILTSTKEENQRVNTDDIRLSNNKEGFEIERRLELYERDEFRRLPINRVSGLSERVESRRFSRKEQNSLDKYERRFNELEGLTENRRFITNFAEESNRRERNNRSDRNNEFARSVDRAFERERLPEETQKVGRQSDGENQRSSERLSQAVTRTKTENHRDNTDDIRLSSNKRVFENERRLELSEREESRRLPIDRVSENERRLELSKREESRRLSLKEDDILDMYERRFKERERLTENRGLIANFAKEDNRQERNNRLESSRESRRSIVRASEKERLPEEREILRRLDQRSNERPSQTDLERESIIRNKAENQRKNINDMRLSKNERVTENNERFELLRRDEYRRLPLREQDVLNKYKHRLDERERLTESRRLKARNIKELDKLERNYDSRRSNERFTKTEEFPQELENQRSSESIPQRDIRRSDIKRESRNPNERHEQERENNERREILKQLANRDNQYDTSSRLNEREHTSILRRSVNSRENSDNRVHVLERDTETKQREFKNRGEILKINNPLDQRDVSRGLSNRFEYRHEYLRERGNILNRNNESQRRLVESEKQSLQNHDNIQRYIREQLKTNSDSRRPDERRDILLDEYIELRRSRRVSESVERRHESNVEQNAEFLQRSERNERQNKNLNYRDLYYGVNEHNEKPTLPFNKSYMAFGQTALLAYIIIKTLNGKNYIKHNNIYEKFQEAISLMGF